MHGFAFSIANYRAVVCTLSASKLHTFIRAIKFALHLVFAFACAITITILVDSAIAIAKSAAINIQCAILCTNNKSFIGAFSSTF